MARFTFTTFQGVVYRATSYDTPVWVSPNRLPARWSHPEDRTVAQYCALDAAAPLAEFVRAENLRQIEDANEVRIGVWQLRITEGAILDLSSPALAGRQNISLDDLIADDWSVCQQLGREIQAEGGGGIVAPNAALPGSLSITTFGPRSELSWSAEPRLAIQVPARQIYRGAPGAGLLRSVRYFGSAYPTDPQLVSAAHLLGQ